MKAYRVYSVCALIGAFTALSLDLESTISHGFAGSVSFNSYGEGWTEVAIAISILPYIGWFAWSQGVKPLLD